MTDWLLKLDPNVVIPVLVGLVTWGYRSIRGQKQDNSKNIIDSVVGTFAHELLDQYVGQDVTAYLRVMRSYVNDRVWSVLNKRGVPNNGFTRAIVNEATERWSAWLGGQLLKVRSGSSKAPLSTELK